MLASYSSGAAWRVEVDLRVLKAESPALRPCQEHQEHTNRQIRKEYFGLYNTISKQVLYEETYEKSFKYETDT